MIGIRRIPHIGILTTLMACAVSAGIAGAVEVQWNFDSASLTPVYNDHTTTMLFRNGATTSGAVQFGTAAFFGIPALPGGADTMMSFPAFAANQGLGVYDLGPANGGGAYVNQYTMAWDIFIPNVNNYLSLYQTAATNTNDGDLFIAPDGTLGIAGVYHGNVSGGAWHRIVATIDGSNAVKEMRKYIDGTFVGTTLLDSVDGRWSMYKDSDVNVPPDADVNILADNSGDMIPGYISMFYYSNSVVDAATVQAWGGADADGILVPEPGSFALLAGGLLGLVFGRRRRA